jgi:hypothetical protein
LFWVIDFLPSRLKRSSNMRILARKIPRPAFPIAGC